MDKFNGFYEDAEELEDLRNLAEAKRLEDMLFPVIREMENKGLWDWNNRRIARPEVAERAKQDIEKTFKGICRTVVGSSDIRINFKFFEPFYSGAIIEICGKNITFSDPVALMEIMGSEPVIEVTGTRDGKTRISFEYKVGAVDE